MRSLSNTVLLAVVWGIAITGLLALSASIARADVIRADLVRSNDIAPNGRMAVVYEPSLFNAQAVYFEVAGDHNFGIYSRDLTPIGTDPENPTGFVDPQAELWNLTVDAIWGEISIGLGTAARDMLWPDSLQIVKADDESYLVMNHPETGPQRMDVDWSNIAVAVPEASALALGLIGMICLAVRRVV